MRWFRRQESKPSTGETAVALLNNAVRKSDLRAARTAIEQGVGPEELSKCLIPAVGAGVSMVELLVSHGADVNHKNSQYNNGTPLHTCAKRGLLDVARFLIEQGADRNMVDADGNTPLDCALSPSRDLAPGMGLPVYPGDIGKRERKEAVAEFLQSSGAKRRVPQVLSSMDPRVRAQIEDIIPGLVFKAAHIYFRGEGVDAIVEAV